MSTIFALLLLAGAQETRTAYTEHKYDVNGRPVQSVRTTEVRGAAGSQRVTSSSNLNGRSAALERVEERVIREDSAGKVVERIVRTYDATGMPGPMQKFVVEESKQADGSLIQQTTRYDSDVNGRFALRERSRTETSKQGASTSSSTVIERPTVNGTMETVERRVAREQKSGANLEAEETTYRRDQAGRFFEAERLVTQRQESDGRSAETATLYLPGAEGRLQVSSQTVTRAAARPDGTRTSEIDIYRVNAPGMAAPMERGKLMLFEQQKVERTPSSDGAVETVSVRRPPVDGAPPTGPFEKVSERVCTGKCQ